MRCPKYKSDSFCVGGRHRSATKNPYGDITTKVSKVLIGHCSHCNRKKSMTVGDNTIKVEGLGNFFEDLGEKRLNVSKKMTKHVINNQGSFLDTSENVATASAIRNLKNVPSTIPELIFFYHTVGGL